VTPLSPRPLNVPLAIFILVVALTSVGLVSVYSASASLAGYEIRAHAARKAPERLADLPYHSAAYLKKQSFAAAIGLGLLFFFSRYDYRKLKRRAFWIMAASLLLCLLVWAPWIGVKAGGAWRWIRIGPFTLQPSEIAKLGLIVYMAKMLDDRRRFLSRFFSGVFPAMAVTGLFALLIVLEPDFGAAFLLCLIVFGMWICGEVRWFHLGGLALASIPAALVAFLDQPYRLVRLAAFIRRDPEMLQGAGFQLHQSLIAIGSGGPLGLGLGASVQKHHYLYAAHTDFIFAILAEELGFLGTSLVVLLFAALVFLGCWVALNACDLFGALLATGVTLMVFLGAAINMAVAVGLLPTKGLVLPLLSAGGTSLMVTLAAMGILMNIADRHFALAAAQSGPPPQGLQR
jgi:cell division protein FtsW